MKFTGNMILDEDDNVIAVGGYLLEDIYDNLAEHSRFSEIVHEFTTANPGCFLPQKRMKDFWAWDEEKDPALS